MQKLRDYWQACLYPRERLTDRAVQLPWIIKRGTLSKQRRKRRPRWLDTVYFSKLFMWKMMPYCYEVSQDVDN